MAELTLTKTISASILADWLSENMGVTELRLATIADVHGALVQYFEENGFSSEATKAYVTEINAPCDIRLKGDGPEFSRFCQPLDTFAPPPRRRMSILGRVRESNKTVELR